MRLSLKKIWKLFMPTKLTSEKLKASKTTTVKVKIDYDKSIPTNLRRLSKTKQIAYDAYRIGRYGASFKEMVTYAHRAGSEEKIAVVTKIKENYNMEIRARNERNRIKREAFIAQQGKIAKKLKEMIHS